MWYSVKKYKPFEYGKYFVLDTNGGLYVAYCETYADGHYIFLTDDGENEIVSPTHFMHIPFLEIDEQEVLKHEKK